MPSCAVSRRRGEALRAAIFDAVIAELGSVGYGGLTVEGVAAAARTGKASIYRRWATKEDLVVDALRARMPALGEPPDTGAVRTDLLAMLTAMAATVNSPTGCALQTVLSTASRDRDLVRAVHARVLEPRQQMMLALLRRGAARGEVRPEAVAPLVAQVGPALVLHRFLTVGPPVSADCVAAVVDEVLMPLLRP